jgi:hypothetical protein
MWSNFQWILEKKGRAKPERPDVNKTQTAKKFFDVVTPYDPREEDIRKTVRLLKDRRVEKLREVIASIHEQGIEIDDKLRKEFTRAVLDSDLIFRRKRRVSLYLRPVKLLLGLLPFGGAAAEAGHAVTDIAVHAALEAGEFVAEKAATHHADKRNFSQKLAADAMYVIHKNMRGSSGLFG